MDTTTKRKPLTHDQRMNIKRHQAEHLRQQTLHGKRKGKSHQPAPVTLPAWAQKIVNEERAK